LVKQRAARTLGARRLRLEHDRPHVQRLDRCARGGADSCHLAARQGAEKDALHDCGDYGGDRRTRSYLAVQRDGRVRFADEQP
jgi:hypothetical protein